MASQNPLPDSTRHDLSQQEQFVWVGIEGVRRFS